MTSEAYLAIVKHRAKVLRDVACDSPRVTVEEAKTLHEIAGRYEAMVARHRAEKFGKMLDNQAPGL